MKKRHISIKQNEREIGKKRSASGNRLCRFCKTEVLPPRRTFCSELCVHEWKIRSNNKYMRACLYERDLGICHLCSLDTRYQKIELENLIRSARLKYGTELLKDKELSSRLLEYKLTLKESFKSIWHADHIKPVSQGGGESGLDNLRTLCVKCHKDITKKLKRNVN